MSTKEAPKPTGAHLAIAMVGLLSFAQVRVAAADTDIDAVREKTTVLADDVALLALESIELAPEQERVIQELALTDPQVIRLTRILSQPWGRLSATEARDGVMALTRQFGEEGRRAAAPLVAAPYSYTQELVASYLSPHPDSAELMLQSAVASWDRVYTKTKQRLSTALRTLQQPWGEHAAPSPLVEEVIGLMIKDPGTQTPLLGLRLARSLAPTSESVRAAAESQRENAEYDYFKNEYPVRRAALEFLGETYVPPKREPVDYAGISIVDAEGLTASSGLTIGNLTSLYSATGPCAGGRDKYGWGAQFRGMQSAGAEDEVVALLHPIGQVDETPVRRRLEKTGRPGVVLNSASPKDLAYCDVVVLSSIYNLRPEVVDALEAYVWNGGGIVTIDGAGIISCDSEDKLAALLDMPRLSWGWSMIKNQRVVEAVANPITMGLSLSNIVSPGAFNRNGYTFSGAAGSDQVLLRFAPDGSPALRVSTYGKGRIANIGWSPRVGQSSEARDFVRRCMAWAGGRTHTDYFPEPVHSRSRYDSRQHVLVSYSPTPQEMLKSWQDRQSAEASGPGKAVQKLYTAVQRGDVDTVWKGMSQADRTTFMAELDVSDEQVAKQILRAEITDKPQHRLTVDKVQHDGDSATVSATMYRTPDDTTGEVESITLIEEDGRWVLDNNTDTTSEREVGTEALTIQIGEDKVRRVSVSLGLTPSEVVQILSPAGILSADAPTCGCRASDGGMYLFYFLPGERGKPEDDRLAAVAKFSPERPGDPSPENRKPGIFLLPADKRGEPCPREHHEVKAILGSDR